MLEAVYQTRAEREQHMCKGSVLQCAKHPPLPTGSHSQHLAGSGPFLWTVKSLSSFPVWHLTSLGKRLMNWLAFNRFYEARQEHASTDSILNAFSREASHACCVSVQPVRVCRHEGLRGNCWLGMASKRENCNKSNMWPLAYCLTSDEPSLKLLWACWFHTTPPHTHCRDDIFT